MMLIHGFRHLSTGNLSTPFCYYSYFFLCALFTIIIHFATEALNCSSRTKSKRRRKLEHGQNINHVHPHVMESNSPVTAHEDSYEGCMRKDAGMG